MAADSGRREDLSSLEVGPRHLREVELLDRHLEEVAVEHDVVGRLAALDRSRLARQAHRERTVATPPGDGRAAVLMLPQATAHSLGPVPVSRDGSDVVSTEAQCGEPETYDPL
jgi:hypothetical protein